MQYEGLAALIADYIEQRRSQKREVAEKDLEKALKGVDNEIEQASIRVEFAQQVQRLDQQFNVLTWLDDAAIRAKQTSLVTHALKFTHGDAKGSSVLSLDHQGNVDYLITASIANLEIDAVGNAAALDVAKLLQLEFAGQSLAQSLTDGDFSCLASFSSDKAQLTRWVDGLKLALADKTLSSHTLAKQLYFPVADDQYHLLSPIFASSLAHQFNKKISSARFSDEAKAIRDAHKTGKYHNQPDIRFTDTAVQIFGGSKPQNISQLNSQRGGKTYLLNCAPPSWKTVLKPPANYQSIFFSREFNRRSWRALQEFQHYLKRIKGLNSTLDIRRNIANHVNDLADALFNYAAEIQALAEHAGWSHQNCKLKMSERLWLDTWREDFHFQQQRASGNWQQEICSQFGVWLNKCLNDSLKNDGLVFGKVQQQFWSKLLAPRLRDYELGTSVFTANDRRAEVTI